MAEQREGKNLLAPFDDDFHADPYRAYAGLNALAPIHRIRTPSGAAAWLLTGHREVRDGLQTTGWPATSPTRAPTTGGTCCRGR
ncbi:hypothetical protein [Kitasatospora sp. GP82]|uniref:hypothetical protein n=1 Tax=Kitasatospora sp. GP82 TaxID=3035089 RepID=UPI002476A14A|nr:hypothetical protein [Kitasatospora sp. GP82]MDH6127944.1 hypothetical protein [Kitasatospora sp. GP82]